MEPHTSSPSPCKYEVKLNQVKAIGSFTSFQMFHTHTHELTHHHLSITLILPLSFLLFYVQSKSREVGNMWGYPVL